MYLRTRVSESMEQSLNRTEISCFNIDSAFSKDIIRQNYHFTAHLARFKGPYIIVSVLKLITGNLYMWLFIIVV